jgi:hypothetical protein
MDQSFQDAPVAQSSRDRVLASEAKQSTILGRTRILAFDGDLIIIADNSRKEKYFLYFLLF